MNPLDKNKSKVPTNAVTFKHQQRIIALLWITQNSIWLTYRSLHNLATEDKEQCVWQTNFIGLRWILDSYKAHWAEEALQHKITGPTSIRSKRGRQTILIERQELLLLLGSHAFKFKIRANNGTHSVGIEWISNGNQNCYSMLLINNISLL